ncbi:hypothetical protein ACFL6C_03510 [Myxococcota bacterium]
MCWLDDKPDRLAGYRRGDPRVLAEIYREYALPLANQLSRRFSLEHNGAARRCAGIFGPFDLDDVVQDTFMRAFGETVRERFDGRRSFVECVKVRTSRRSERRSHDTKSKDCVELHRRECRFVAVRLCVIQLRDQ